MLNPRRAAHRHNRGRIPLIVRIAVALTLFNSWVLFEEIVVDRLGWWRYMPCYRVGQFCEWDIGATIVITALVILAFGDSRTRVLARLRHTRTRLQHACARLGCRVCRAA